jgi:hypothetical protein
MISRGNTLVTALNQSSAAKLMKCYVMIQIIIQLGVLPLHQMNQMDALVALDKQGVVVVIPRVALSFVVRKKRATIMMIPQKISVAQLIVRGVPALKVKQSAVKGSIHALLSVVLMTRRNVTM